MGRVTRSNVQPSPTHPYRSGPIHTEIASHHHAPIKENNLSSAEMFQMKKVSKSGGLFIGGRGIFFFRTLDNHSQETENENLEVTS